MIAEILNPTAELVICTGTATSEANAEIKIQPLTVEKKKDKMLKVI